MTCVALVALLWCGGVWAQSAQDEFRRGMAAYAQQDRALAQRLFLKAAGMDATYAAPRFNLAQLAEQDERWAEALKWYGEFLALDKTSPYSEAGEKKVSLIKGYIESDKTPEGRKQRTYLQYLQRTQQLLAGGNAGAAMAYAELAVQLDAARFEAYLLYGLALMDNERWAAALERLEAASARSGGPEKAEIAQLIAKCRENLDANTRIEAADKLFQQGNHAGAAAAYGEIWTLLNQPEYGFLAARSWSLARNEDNAVRIYDRLAASRDRGLAARANREKAALLSSSRRALEPTSNAEAMKPAEAAAFAQGTELLRKKNYYEADARLTQALDGVLPAASWAPVFDARGSARLAMKEYLGATQDLSMALMLSPRLSGAWVRRAESYAGAGQFQQAVQDIDRAIELQADDPGREQLRAIRKQYMARLEAMQ